MKVTVTQGIRVAHDGKVYQNGQSADVPERVTRHWIHCGWANESRPAGTLPAPRGLASSSEAASQAQGELELKVAKSLTRWPRDQHADTHDGEGEAVTMSDRHEPQPWCAKPKPVIQHSGSGYDRESCIVTPSDDAEQRALPPRPTPRLHSGVPPSPRR